MSALGDARVEVAAALIAVGVPVHDQPPATLQPPCVVVVPGSPWIVPRGAVTFDVLAYANPSGGNSTALTRLEDLVEAIRGGLWAAGLAPGETQPPEFNPDSGALSASTPVTLRTVCK